MNFLLEKNPFIFDIDNWLWKYDFGTFWQTIIHCRIVLKQFPLSMLILGQKCCILGPTIFKIPEPNWHCIRPMLNRRKGQLNNDRLFMIFCLKNASFSGLYEFGLHLFLDNGFVLVSDIAYLKRNEIQK